MSYIFIESKNLVDGRLYAKAVFYANWFLFELNFGTELVKWGKKMAQ